MSECDYIGPNPIIWIERLISVCAQSQFEKRDKDIIHAALLDLLVTLNPVQARKR